MFKRFWPKFSSELGIDLGTSTTLVYLRGKGIVINEPSVVAINIKTEQILAVGNEAKSMLGKTPPHITVTRPLTNGIISDYEVTEKMLKYFIDKVNEDRFMFINRPKVIICTPLEVTEVEIKAVEDATIAAGARKFTWCRNQWPRQLARGYDSTQLEILSSTWRALLILPLFH